ncbi:MAG: hypothetical protein F4Y02_11275 [Chloroflexi bacterium]|nr:hypothetical protein [Chloroflexota bacterium]
MQTVCKLCVKEENTLLSHIIPEWGYAGAYDNKHRFVPYDALNEKEGRIEQKGIRERMLCGKCETVFSKWEQYGKSVWELKTGQWKTLSNGSLVGLNLEYKKLRLFLLSILWRAHVAEGCFAENVALGPHGERIRLMLLNNDPNGPELYPCMMMRIFEGNTPQEVGLRFPICGRWYGERAYSVAFKGIGLLYIMKRGARREVSQRRSINIAGELVIGTSQALNWVGGMENLQIAWPVERLVREAIGDSEGE